MRIDSCVVVKKLNRHNELRIETGVCGYSAERICGFAVQKRIIDMGINS